MAGQQPARGGARLFESIDAFMERRRREVEHLGSAAEAAAHDAVRKAIRAGQEYRLATPGEVMAYGTKLIRGEQHRKAAGSQPTFPATVKPRVWDSAPAKAVGGTLAYGAGFVPGMARGALHTLEGAADGASFAVRLTNPAIDLITSAPGHSAHEEVFNMGRLAGDYARRAIEDPSIVRRDVDSAVGNFRVKQDPTATPVADTLGGEMKQAWNLGMNNGELLFDVGSTLVGGEGIRGAAGLGRMAKAADAVELAHLANNPGTAAAFERAYPKRGMSHHIVNRAATLPKALGGGAYPDWFIESEFNKIRHDDISYRDLYRNHRGVGGDNHFTGGRIPREFGGGGFRTDDLGWDTYGPLDRLRYGTSPATKAVVGPVLVGGVVDNLLRQEDAP